MRRSEYEERLKELNRQIEELKKVEIEEDGIWKPEYDEDYWYVNSECYVYKHIWTDHHIDKLMLLCGNIFKTKKEAEYEAERLKVYRKLRQFALKSGRHEGNFSIVYDYVTKEIDYWENETAFQRFGDLIFKTEEDARRAVETVGVDKVLKYYLEV